MLVASCAIHVCFWSFSYRKSPKIWDTPKCVIMFFSFLISFAIIYNKKRKIIWKKNLIKYAYKIDCYFVFA